MKTNTTAYAADRDPTATADMAPSQKGPSLPNTLLWILQAALALLYFSGGAYKVFSFDELAGQLSALPRQGWTALGVLELVGAVLLIVPAAARWRPQLTPAAAALLALEGLGLTLLYAQYSLAPTAENPLLWSAAMTLATAFVAYGRYARWPVQPR